MGTLTSPAVQTKTEKLAAKVKAEIAVALGAAVAAVNALQLLAVSVPSWVHVVIVVATTVAASLGIRAKVTPNDAGVAA